MTGFDYAKSAATAQRLLEKFGKEMAVRRKTGGEYNTATSRATAPGEEEPVHGAILEYSPFVIANSGGSIRQEHRRILLSPLGLSGPPEPMDEVVNDNDVYTILACNPLKPADIVVLYDVQVKR